ncbi:MAG: sigma 54-interacting transcriptional regulator [Desulfovibrio sp.]|nr:sigma 54-interacting transcriptional regulator [Desulfovibrio sp.]
MLGLDTDSASPDCLAAWIGSGSLEAQERDQDLSSANACVFRERTGIGWLISWAPAAEHSARRLTFTRLPESPVSQANMALELDRILESIHDGIWVIDGDGITRRVNRAMERIAGIRAEEVVGRHVSEPLREGKFKTCVTLRALEEKRTVTLFDDYSNGRRCLNTSTPIYGEDGQVWRVIAAIRDLTELDALKDRLSGLEMETLAHKRRAQGLDSEEGAALIGESEALARAMQEIAKASQCDAITLILGETGTGKSLAARLIHEHSHRAHKPFVTVNCGAIPATLIESELFGYERGAFTGAIKNGKPGLFELAAGGTLLLDEIGELSLEMQAKLLHILDGQPIYRLGSARAIRPNTRIIAATNQPLDKLAASGAFRQDLYYRLAVLCILLPPLRERKADIPQLAKYFLERADSGKKFSPEALRLFPNYDWPGNVRELRNVVQSLAVLCENGIIMPENLPRSLNQGIGSAPDSLAPRSLGLAIANLEKGMLGRALAEGGSTYKAARILGISQSQVARKARKYGLLPQQQQTPFTSWTCRK